MSNPAVVLKAEIDGSAAGFVAALDEAGKKVSAFSRKSVETIRDLSTKIAVGATAFGAAITGALGVAAAKSQSVTDALGEMASLGTKDLDGLRKAAMDFSDEFTGASSEQFIRSAYDIRSAISTLSDDGVVAVTRFSAITAKATKASAEEMSRAFTTAYGVFKPMAKEMGDAEWAERFSSIMAKTVQNFRTTGSQMNDALKNLGATGAASLVPLEEQMAILGQLQTVMPGAEAGTQYKAFLLNIAKGADELGINVTDATGRLRSLPVILEAIRKKFPDLTSAAAQMELKKALGSEEAYRFVLQMSSGVGQLRGNIDTLGQAFNGTENAAVSMAEAMNTNLYVIFQQRIANLFAEVGLIASKFVVPFVEKLNEIVGAIRSWIQDNPVLAERIIAVVGAIGVLSLAIGALATTIATGAAGYLMITAAMTKMGFAATLASGGFLAMGKAMLLAAAPVVLLVAKIALIGAAIGGLVYLVVTNWQTIVEFTKWAAGEIYSLFSDVFAVLWEPVSGFFWRFVQGVQDMWSVFFEVTRWAALGVYLLFSDIFAVLWEPVSSFFSGFTQGAQDMWGGFVDAARNAFGVVFDFLEKARQWISEIWGKITETITGSKSIQTLAATAAPANIPQARNGGILSGPESGFLAMLHGTELVVPMPDGTGSRIADLPDLSGRGSVTNNTPVNISINQLPGQSANDLARAVANEFRRMTR